MAGALARRVPTGPDNVSKPEVRSRPGLAEPRDGEDVPGAPDRAGDRDPETRRTGARAGPARAGPEGDPVDRAVAIAVDGREPAMQPMIEPLPASAGEATGPADFRARLVQRDGRKEMQLPDGASSQHRMDDTPVKALARAFRWKRKPEAGEFTTLAELADRKGTVRSRMTRIPRLTLPAPDNLEAILDGLPGPDVTPARVMEPFALSWNEQGKTLSGT